MEYKLHHIGLATKDIESTTHMLTLMGYKADELKFDPLQNVDVRFLYHEANPPIELIGGGIMSLR